MSEGQSSPFAVGQGYDVHRLIPGRRLFLGGVEFDYRLGLDGHSDADVVLHAVMDSLLGACGEGDIGHHFPNTDERWRDASSLDMLDLVAGTVIGSGWSVGNIDVTVIAEAPKIGAHIGNMRERIASVLRIPTERVNIKATTAEGTGPEGRHEAISAFAVALLIRQ